MNSPRTIRRIRFCTWTKSPTVFQLIIIHNYDVFVIISVVSSIESDQIGLKTVEKNLSDGFFS